MHLSEPDADRPDPAAGERRAVLAGPVGSVTVEDSLPHLGSELNY